MHVYIAPEPGNPVLGRCTVFLSVLINLSMCIPVQYLYVSRHYPANKRLFLA